MAVLSAEEWLKQQQMQAAQQQAQPKAQPKAQPQTQQPANKPGNIITAQQYQQVNQAQQAQAQPQGQVYGPVIPNDIGNWFGSGIIEQFLLEPLRWVEEGTRVIPATAFEFLRAVDKNAGTETNPWIPGWEELGAPGKTVETVGRKAAGVAAAVTIAKFPFANNILASAIPAAGIGMGATASKPGTTPKEIATAGLVSAPFGPAGVIGGRLIGAGIRTAMPVSKTIMAGIPRALEARVAELGAGKVGSEVGAAGATRAETGIAATAARTGETLTEAGTPKLLPAAGETTKPPIITPPPAGEETLPGGVLQRYATEHPGQAVFKVDNPTQGAADDILDTVAKPEPAIGTVTQPEVSKPYATRDHVPGEQFSFVSITNKNPFITTIIDGVKERVRGMSLAGRRLAYSLDRQAAETATTRGETVDLRNTIVKLGRKLSTEEKNEFFKLREAGQAATNPKYAELDRNLTQYYGLRKTQGNQYELLINDQTGLPVGDSATYINHRFNNEGRDVFNKDPNKFWNGLAKENGKTPEEMRSIYARFADQREPIQAFEKQRQFKIPDQWLEKDPGSFVNQYEDQFSRRYAGAEVFGKDMKAAYDLAGQIGQETTRQYDVKFATDLINESVGLNATNIEANHELDKWVSNAVNAKLSLLTSSKNISQGLNAVSKDFGPFSAFNALFKTFTKEGRAWAKDIGFGLGSRSGFYQSHPVGRLAQILNTIWEKTTGFPLTEDLNFVTTSIGSKESFEGIARALIKNPTNKLLRNKLELWGIDAEQVLAAGKIPDKELKIASANYAIKSVFPKVAGTMQEWTKNPAGQAFYLFQRYTFGQAQFVQENFKLGAVQGVKALGQMALTAALSGEIALGAESAIMGKKRPENIFARLLEDESAILFPLLYSTIQSAGYAAGSVGPIYGGILKTATNVSTSLGQKDISKATSQLLRAYLRGDLPMIPTVPQGALIERKLFGKKPEAATTPEKTLQQIYSPKAAPKSNYEKQLNKIYGQ